MFDIKYKKEKSLSEMKNKDYDTNKRKLPALFEKVSSACMYLQ